MAQHGEDCRGRCVHSRLPTQRRRCKLYMPQSALLQAHAAAGILARYMLMQGQHTAETAPSTAAPQPSNAELLQPPRMAAAAAPSIVNFAPPPLFQATQLTGLQAVPTAIHYAHGQELTPGRASAYDRHIPCALGYAGRPWVSWSGGWMGSDSKAHAGVSRHHRGCSCRPGGEGRCCPGGHASACRANRGLEWVVREGW